MKQYCYYPSPIGELLLTGSSGILQEIYFPCEAENITISTSMTENKTSFSPVRKQLSEYFAGERKTFSIPFSPAGTPFQGRVWMELQKIPYGHTASYGEIAERIGNPKACRAIGMANGKNPIPIIIPCHRIIGKDGSMTGFGGGLKIKKFLLDLEQRG
ncbi:MAG: methylated-DNA--[protein]-cysteine S-methyltransferase [Desulfobulbaceae bacterium]|nr:methylated-DNA--[protein]-cysteine S-methyltransferase [Desulfobulbaceae bacterium]